MVCCAIDRAHDATHREEFCATPRARARKGHGGPCSFRPGTGQNLICGEGAVAGAAPLSALAARTRCSYGSAGCENTMLLWKRSLREHGTTHRPHNVTTYACFLTAICAGDSWPLPPMQALRPTLHSTWVRGQRQHETYKAISGSSNYLQVNPRRKDPTASVRDVHCVMLRPAVRHRPTEMLTSLATSNKSASTPVPTTNRNTPSASSRIGHEVNETLHYQLSWDAERAREHQAPTCACGGVSGMARARPTAAGRVAGRFVMTQNVRCKS